MIYYQDSYCTIYHGNCLELLPSLSEVDFVLTDPPYKFESQGGGFYGVGHGRFTGECPRDHIGKLQELNCTDFEPEPFLAKLSCQYGVFFCNKELIDRYIRFARESGLLFDVHVMHKTNPIPAKSNHWLHDVEYLVLMRPKGSYFNPDTAFDNYRKCFPYYNSGTWSIDKLHPAQKPVSAISRYIEVCTKPGMTVLDPYMGSGTTLLGAKQHGRKAIGIEREEAYCEVAAKRLQQEYLPLGGNQDHSKTVQSDLFK